MKRLLSGKAVGMLLRAGITLALAAYVASKIDLPALSQRLAGLTGTWLLAALGVLTIQIGLASARWHRIIFALHGKIGFQRCLRYEWEGQFFSQVLVSSVGGDVVRIFRIHREGLSGGTAGATVLLDRLSALAVVLISVALSVPILSELVRIPGFAMGLLTILGAGILGFAFLFVMDRVLKLPLSWRLTRFLHQLAADARRLILRPGIAAIVLGCSFLVLFLSAFTLFLLGKSLDVGLGLTQAMVFTPLVILLTTLPISIAGWGVREVGMVVLLEQVGVARTDAVALSVAFGLALLITALPGGVLWIFGSRSGQIVGNNADEESSKRNPS